METPRGRARALGTSVVQHDDGSRPGMHDCTTLHPERQLGVPPRDSRYGLEKPIALLQMVGEALSRT